MPDADAKEKKSSSTSQKCTAALSKCNFLQGDGADEFKKSLSDKLEDLKKWAADFCDTKNKSMRKTRIVCVLVLLMTIVLSMTISHFLPERKPGATQTVTSSSSLWPWSSSGQSASPSYKSGVEYVCPENSEPCGVGCLVPLDHENCPSEFDTLRRLAGCSAMTQELADGADGLCEGDTPWCGSQYDAFECCASTPDSQLGDCKRCWNVFQWRPRVAYPSPPTLAPPP